ncbi:GntR family transcriptional regulator [Niallia circulans]|uniref:GntR family transcriptional regulator n=2 Tax=Bacillaceae TaxID=186817 RepID=A0A268F7V3_NIACI|nr:GntR family transcriptional regulator [Niallia circulans]AYV72392.1 GntR family transcriptional regulator [Niallia circulans]NRG28419.1 GntR family transcriptional regulator [Niallia circulans]PAD81428.1 GntR family transcriptional regulator [Niallia circulans]QJX64679.1 GntR family transcriptional regulator [Niallia circulans]
MMDINESIPKYEQLRMKILNDIERGILKKGDKIPTENELSKNNQISRVTVRKALDSLTEEGYLIRIPGKGTFITENKLLKDIGNTIGFSENTRMQGKKPGARVIENKIIDLEEEEQNVFGTLGNTKQISIVRVRTADDIPVSVEYSRFPMDFDYLLTEDLNNTSLYDIIKEKSNIKFGNSRKAIQIVSASFEEAMYLNVKEGHPVLCIESLVKDIKGSTIHSSKQIMLGDKFTLIV